jgi:hypothetical protein
MTTTQIAALENQLRAEVEAARATLKVALQRAANAGRAYGAIQDFLTQSQVQAWLASPSCKVDRHTVMTCRRIAMSDLDKMARTLGDVALDAVATHIAKNADKRSRSEMIEANRAKLQANNASR